MSLCAEGTVTSPMSVSNIAPIEVKRDYLFEILPQAFSAGGASRDAKFLNKRRLKTMKIVSLCAKGSCCPVIKITDTEVEVGEKDNRCILTKEQWETLKEKILKKEL